MRKILGILILFLYLTLSAVDVISIHLCQGDVKSIGLSEPKEHCCSDMNADCCEDIVIKVDFDTEHISPQVLTLSEEPETHLLTTDLLYKEHRLQEVSRSLYLLPQPDPPLPDRKLYHLYSSFLFYG